MVLALNNGEGVGYHFVLKKELKKADFTGLKLRTSSFYDPMVKALGGATVKIAGGEIYSSLEKGVVDGAAWPVMGALDFKWHEVSKFRLRPAFGEVVEILLINRNSLDKLPKDLQDLIMLINITIGGITPPFGYVLFAFKATSDEITVQEVYRAITPFVLLYLLGMLLIAIFPPIATWLPSKI